MVQEDKDLLKCESHLATALMLASCISIMHQVSMTRCQ